MKNIKNKIRAVAALLVIVCVPLLSGCGTSSPGYIVNLEIWGTKDDSTVYNEIINQYKKINPYVGEIKYRKFSESTYRQELLDALASGQGPDIFLINNGWFPSFENKIEPAPTPFVSENDMKSSFPDVVAGDFMSAGKAYAVPLSVDSMALYYNQDMFNAAGITSAPKTWQDFDDAVAKLVKIDSTGNILQAGAAIGTAQNVNKSVDLLSLLMFQNGVQFPRQKGDLAKFDEGTLNSNGMVVQAGQQALEYYTKFAKLTTGTNSTNLYYTWNSQQKDSIEAFSEGKVGMMFNYYSRFQDIKNMNSKLNFAVAAVPQAYPDKPVTYANYWGYAVAKNKTASLNSLGQQSAVPVTNEMRTHESWEFLKFLTLKNTGKVTLYNAISKNSKDFPISFDPALDYLKRTQLPAARRDIIESQKTDSVLGVFASGNLIAKHWYQYDSDAVVGIMKNAIDSVNSNQMTLHDALVLARNRVNALQGGSLAN